MSGQKLSDQIYAAHRVLREQQRLTGCTSFVQRKLDCGYNRAALLLAFLEDAKVLGMPDHSETLRGML